MHYLATPCLSVHGFFFPLPCLCFSSSIFQCVCVLQHLGAMAQIRYNSPAECGACGALGTDTADGSGD